MRFFITRFPGSAWVLSVDWKRRLLLLIFLALRKGNRIMAENRIWRWILLLNNNFNSLNIFMEEEVAAIVLLGFDLRENGENKMELNGKQYFWKYYFG
jgi:hypothetical protein